jgi:hypothetical protein
MHAGILLAISSMLSATDNPRWAPWLPEGKPEYTVKRTAERPLLKGDWEHSIWREANQLSIENFLGPAPESPSPSAHRPKTTARVLYDEKGLYIFFRVEDQYVRSIATEYRGKVWEDACAEFFVQPKLDRGYFNFEINCGGTMLLSYHENPDFHGDASRKDGGVPWELAKSVEIFHSMPKTVDPEIAEKKTWYIEYHIPFVLLEEYVGKLGPLSGQTWRANFYKCAETNSNPHWAAWSAVTKESTFHAPRYFGILHFE